MRKIVHVDMDAFYASVAQRDDPALRGRPVVVAWRGPRSVVCAASYEARRYGVHSAMPAARAERLCPQAVFVAPDFARYREVSQRIRVIFARHSTVIEPLSLDEAYLDVTENLSGLPSATRVAEVIRRQIREELELTASAGVAPNKFLAKVASDWHKPDGLFVIRPGQVTTFLASLPVVRIPGVGAVTEAQLRRLGIETVGQLTCCPAADLVRVFGRFGRRLAELAQGIDERPVRVERPVKSISSEDTFEQDLPLSATEPAICRLAEKTWQATAKTARVGRTVVLKLKTSDFRTLTRSLTPASPPASGATLARIALRLRERVTLPPTTRYRLVGVGLGNFSEAVSMSPAQPTLFPVPDDDCQ